MDDSSFPRSTLCQNQIMLLRAMVISGAHYCLRDIITINAYWEPRRLWMLSSMDLLNHQSFNHVNYIVNLTKRPSNGWRKAICRYSARRLSVSADRRSTSFRRPRRFLGQSLFRFASRKKAKNRLERSPAPKSSPIALVISPKKMDRRTNGEPNSVRPEYSGTNL